MVILSVGSSIVIENLLSCVRVEWEWFIPLPWPMLRHNITAEIYKEFLGLRFKKIKEVYMTTIWSSTVKY